jgi:hypothetical protein
MTGDGAKCDRPNLSPVPPRCLVPRCGGGGTIDVATTKEALWDRYFTEAPLINLPCSPAAQMQGHRVVTGLVPMEETEHG